METLNRVGAKPSQAVALRNVALQRVAVRLDGNRARSLAYVMAGSAMVAAIEGSLYQPPALKDHLFFPSDASRSRFLAHLRRATRSLDVAIFSLTDDRIRDALIAAHARGVTVRVISDDVTTMNAGSDILDLARAGIQTVIDSEIRPSAANGRRGGRHMHNKFVLMDRRVLITGSFNFTYAASSKNCENLIITDDSFHVQRYGKEFTRLWAEFYTNTYSECSSRQEAAIKLQAVWQGRKARAAARVPSAAMARAPPPTSSVADFPTLGAWK